MTDRQRQGKFWDDFLRHPTYSSIIGTIVGGIGLFGLSVLGAYILGGWNKVFPAIWFCLTYRVGIPVWLLVPLGGICLWLVVGAFRQKVQASHTPSEAKPELTVFDYREDRIQDIDWKWRYLGGNIDQDSIVPFCPDDGTPLITKLDVESTAFGQTVPFVAYCETCKKTLPMDDIGSIEYKAFIARQVAGKINRGEWRTVIEAQRAAKLARPEPIKPPEAKPVEPPKPPDPPYRLYVKDRFQDVDWEWEWEESGGIKSDSIHPFCPKDCTPLILQALQTKEGNYIDSPIKTIGIVAYCETCKAGFKMEVPRGTALSEWEVKKSIARQIERKKKSGEWRAVVEAQQSAKLTPVVPINPPEAMPRSLKT